nr:MAG TPA: hypothetical protein [Caudoviricetes sp.]
MVYRWEIFLYTVRKWGMAPPYFLNGGRFVGDKTTLLSSVTKIPFLK